MLLDLAVTSAGQHIVVTCLGVYLNIFHFNYLCMSDFLIPLCVCGRFTVSFTHPKPKFVFCTIIHFLSHSFVMHLLQCALKPWSVCGLECARREQTWALQSGVGKQTLLHMVVMQKRWAGGWDWVRSGWGIEVMLP